MKLLTRYGHDRLENLLPKTVHTCLIGIHVSLSDSNNFVGPGMLQNYIELLQTICKRVT